MWGETLNILSVLLLVSIVYYGYLSIEVYLKLHFLQEQTTAYFTTLITQIKSCKGYDDQLSIVFVRENIEDLTLTEIAKADNIQMAVVEWNLIEWINSYTLIQYIK